MPVYQDETHSDLVWLKFEGPTWDDFHQLMSQFEAWIAEQDEPFRMVFHPTIDMPKGAPITHIKRMIRLISDEPKLLHMIVVLPKNMVIAKLFADISYRLFPNQTMAATIVTDVNAVYPAYQEISRTNTT